jgi:hypothetical protein
MYDRHSKDAGLPQDFQIVTLDEMGEEEGISALDKL